MFTVRLTFRIKNSRRLLKTFIRKEGSLNTSSHAIRFATQEDAENAADVVAENFTGMGHTLISADFFRVDF